MARHSEVVGFYSHAGELSLEPLEIWVRLTFLQPWSIVLIGQAESQQERNSHQGAAVHEGDVAPINGVPFPNRPVHVNAQRIDTVQMAKVGNKQAEEQRPPHADVARRAENQGFVESEEKVQIGKLGQHHSCGEGYIRRWSRSGMGKVKIGSRLVMGVVGASDGRKGLDPEKEKTIDERR